jgi:hypothetical protein
MPEDSSYGQAGDDRLDTGDVRRVAATALVVVGCALALVGGLTLYAREQVFDADRFASRASVSLKDEDLRTVLSDRIVEEIIDQGSSELIQAKPLLQAVVSNVMVSAPFRAIFRKAAVQVHRALFSRDEGSIVLDLADTGTVVIGAAKAVAPGVAKKIPSDVQPGLIEVSERSFATGTLKVADRVRFLGILLPLLALGCFVAAYVLALDRRQLTVTLGAGVATAAALGVIAYIVGRALLLARFEDEEEHRAVAAVWDSFLVDLRTWSLVVGGAGIVVAAAASTYLQHVDLTDEAQAVGRRLLARPRRRSLQLVRALGIAAVSLFVVLEPTYAVQIAVIVVGAFGLYYAVGELMRLYQPAARRRAGAPDERVRLRGYSRRVAVVGLCVVLAAGTGISLLFVGGGGEGGGGARARVPITACNGYAALCGRPLNQVAFPSTHNSMSAADERGWYFAGQRRGIRQQLEDGVRGLLIDTHYGVPNAEGRVRTNLEREGTTRAKVVSEIGEEGVAAAQRLVGRLGFGDRAGADRLYACHTLCELGATPLSDVLGDLKGFLEDYPNEVVLVFVQDATAPRDTARSFEQAGLGPYLYAHDRDAPWPTLRQMIRSGRRVMVLAEERVTGAPPWYHLGFDLVQETPYSFTDPQALRTPASCSPNRGTANSPLFQLNHWVERVNPSPSLAERVNAYGVLLARARRCRSERGLLPNLVNVDFYDEGDLFGAVRALNRLPRAARPSYARTR